MDYDVSISIGTTANLGDLTKANKAVQDLAKAAKQVPDSLLSGGVGGTAAPAYTGAATGGGMTWRLEGAAELSNAVKTMDGALRQAGKNFTVTSQRMDRSASLLSRSISTLTSLPGKLQAWGSSTMQSWNQFNGGLQNLKNVIGLGKQAWDLGWSIGESLNEAFGVKAKQIDAKLAGIIQAAQDKLARWQDSVNSARAQHREDAFLKQEAAGVKQVNDAYAARLRTIEAIDRKAMAGLEMQQKLLQIENEKNRSIINQRRIRGEITESQARDELARIDAKDANERMDIERKQADQAAQTAQARADAAEERYRKLLEFSRSSQSKQLVEGLKPIQVMEEADAAKRAEEDLARWKAIQQRQKDAQKKIQEAIKDQARAATMLPLAGAPIALARKQDEDQARQDYEAAVAAQHEFMRAKGMSFNETDKGNEELLKKKVDQHRQALGKLYERISKTGLVGDLNGMNDDERRDEYVRILQLARSTIDDDSARLEEALREMQDARQQAAEASSRLKGVLTEHQAQTAANEAVNQETAKTNAQQDAVKHTDVMASALEDRLRKEIEIRQRNQEKQKEVLARTNERLDASMERFQQYAESFEGNDALAAKLKQFSDIFARLKALPRSAWDKKDLKDAKAAEKFAKELSEAAKHSTNQDEKGIAQAAMQAIKAWQDALKKERAIKKNDKELRDLERTAQDVTNLSGKLHDGQEKVLELDDWLARMRRKVLGRSGEIANKEPIGALPYAEEMLKKVLSEQGDGGTSVTQGERKLLEHLKSRLENDDRRLEAGNEFNEMIGLIDQILTRYSSAQSAQGKLSGEVARLKARLDKIDSQGKFGPRR
ncbi:hypothetical protein [Akkermansia muciniphila]|jgi:hypothetical protein|uniref:hypothetical protein n=1 Tax=Akkermansia muciniphila TaxID=239935 RepID=UPI00138E79A8|nr:hypothetical protein [Akkermansia muciniphila]DAW01845.1 MAG TPA: MAEBL protein [Caudoviricetes sp.]QHV49680.1 hypothetical protein DFS30_10940 [Akkermansia muciniphila]QTE98148.1 hypothetical protein J4027_10955 [Akkermansia muciniphila]QTF00462.1 hypothetical protein J4Z33_10940 [Akkermansia muciniphila]QTF02772.1 hypothetical protein J4Z36_10940 [Akkermansia muciniphila]